jgi:hypothetical protein
MRNGYPDWGMVIIPLAWIDTTNVPISMWMVINHIPCFELIRMGQTFFGATTRGLVSHLVNKPSNLGTQ